MSLSRIKSDVKKLKKEQKSKDGGLLDESHWLWGFCLDEGIEPHGLTTVEAFEKWSDAIESDRDEYQDPEPNMVPVTDKD